MHRHVAKIFYSGGGESCIPQEPGLGLTSQVSAAETRPLLRGEEAPPENKLH